MRATSTLLVGALAIIMALALPTAAKAQIAISITIPPPELPVYVQPPCPAPGYMWTPGYWAWGPDGYYWVPGTWVQPPAIGLLWTPGYWGWSGGVYLWNAGYWGPHIGFYGGVVYGCGYDGVGFQGGYWQAGQFYYNQSVTNVNVTVVRNVYTRPVAESTVTRVSYNGGRGGIAARPSPEQLMAARENHRPATTLQVEHQHVASRNRELLASVNHGRPPAAATAKPGLFRGRDIVPARGAPDAGAVVRPANGHQEPAVNLRGQRGESHGALNPSAEHWPETPNSHKEGHALAATAPASPHNYSAQPRSYNEHSNAPRFTQGNGHTGGAPPIHGNPSAGKPAFGGGHPSPGAHKQAAKESAPAHPQGRPKEER